MKLSTQFFFFCGGVIAGGILVITFFDLGIGSNAAQVNDESKPLYWVAPMDSNYRRDKPGKSPMGMDLIPVYEENDGGSASPGAIKISPEVVNNLGVRYAQVSQQILSTEIKTVGYINYDEDLLSHIHPRVEGWIEKLYIKAEGDPLTRGQPLYELYSPSLVSAQEEFLLALSRKNRQLIRAARARLQALQIPDSLIQKLEKQKQVSQTITFYSPRDGFVDNLNIREGFFVKPGTMLMSIGELKKVWVEAEIFERQVSFVKAGMPAEMQLDYLPGKNWQGKVDYIYPKLDAKTRTVKLRLVFDNQDGFLKPNMFAQVLIHGQAERKSMVVPKQAVIRTGRQDRVVVALDEGRFKSVEVNLGMQNESSVEILSGLKDDDKVVVSAQFLIDSESSKTSDFMRMTPLVTEAESANATGKINSIDQQKQLVNISRGPIEKWNRPAATMDFLVDNNIELRNFSVAQSIAFTFEIRDGEFVIVAMSDDGSNNTINNE